MVSQHRFLRPFSRGLRLAYGGRLQARERRTTVGWASARNLRRIHLFVRILVPVIAELAERVPGGRRHRRALDLAAAARLAGIKAGLGTSCANRRITRAWRRRARRVVVVLSLARTLLRSSIPSGQCRGERNARCHHRGYRGIAVRVREPQVQILRTLLVGLKLYG